MRKRLRAALVAAAVLVFASGPIRGAGPRDSSSRPKGGEGIPPFPYRVQADVSPSGGPSNLNGIFEPGETVAVGGSWYQIFGLPWFFTASASQFSGPPGAAYTIIDGAATYILPAGGAPTFCSDCYVMSIDDPAVRPAQHWDVTFAESTNFGDGVGWTLHVGRSFPDVPVPHLFYAHVEALFHAGVTSGCGAGYCPDASVTRAQMAVFLLKGKNGSAYVPPPATGTVFDDVPADSFAADWIEDLYSQGIADACHTGPLMYCPAQAVTRAEMAVSLLKAKLGSDHVPPPCVGLFADVPCEPSPAYPVDWIEELYAAGITGGCGGGNFCPDTLNTRGQMAVFITKTFGLAFTGL